MAFILGFVESNHAEKCVSGVRGQKRRLKVGGTKVRMNQTRHEGTGLDPTGQKRLGFLKKRKYKHPRSNKI